MGPLIVRRARVRYTAPAIAVGAELELEQGAAWMDDLRLFAFGWVAGLVVFGTLLA